MPLWIEMLQTVEEELIPTEPKHKKLELEEVEYALSRGHIEEHEAIDLVEIHSLD